jgi:hypothetical protein
MYLGDLVKKGKSLRREKRWCRTVEEIFFNISLKFVSMGSRT